MKLTKPQIFASILLLVLTIILILCYTLVPQPKKKNVKIPEMKETKLNDYVSIKTMTEKQLQNEDTYPYIKSYNKDLLKLQGLNEKDTVQFLREISLTELEITNALYTAKTNKKKNSVEVKRKVSSQIENDILDITVTYHLTGYEDRKIQLLIDLKDNHVIDTQTMLKRQNLNVNHFATKAITTLFDSLTSKVEIISNEEPDVEIQIEDWKQKKQEFIQKLEREINNFSYTWIDDKFTIYYSYDQIFDIIGYTIYGIKNNNNFIKYIFQ